MSPLDETTFDRLGLAWIGLALLLLPIQLRVAAPYGRHMRPGWGPELPSRRGWVVMEVVPLIVFVPLFLVGPTAKTAPMWVFFGLWAGHYLQRGLIFPFRLRTAGKRMPLVIVASGVFFNTVNAALNGGYLGWLAAPYPASWLVDPRFLTGAALFAAGAAINLLADNRLMALRRTGAPDYTMPQGGLFRYVSCPNHFGEIVEWSGFALMCWNLPALSFAVWTAANLVPRALSHHRWYRARFAAYPAERKAVIPFIL